MRLLPIHPFTLAAPIDAAVPSRLLGAGSTGTYHSANLLRRTPNDNNEAPDPRFWTSYDHFMLEREARARRREYLYGLIARLWRNLDRRRRASPVSSGKTHATG
jgi:hypothetical protein